MKNQKKVLLLLVISIICFVFCSCVDETIQANPNDTVANDTELTSYEDITSTTEQFPSPTIAPCNSEKDIINTDKLKEAMLTSINDNIWYRGKFSHFDKLESQTLEFELYMETSREESIFVVFRNKIDDEIYAILYAYFEDTIRNEPSGSMKRYTIEQINDELLMTNSGYKPTGIINSISFPSVTEPVYPEMTERKEYLLNEMVNKLPNELKVCNYPVGKYKTYIRNFRENDSRTFIVVEDNYQNSWVMHVDNLGKNGDVHIGKKEKITSDRDDLKYAANQYRKNPILETEIEIK